jgi:hypothetical protein
MRASVLIVLLLVVSAASGCMLLGDADDRLDGATLASGTSFGMCLGYCRTELTVSPDRTATMRWIPQGSGRATVTETRTLSEEEYDTLRDAFDRDCLLGADEVYGCPDCADGGAEYVEMQDGATVKRVAFEYGTEVGGLGAFIEAMRTLRASFDDVAPSNE